MRSRRLLLPVWMKKGTRARISYFWPSDVVTTPMRLSRFPESLRQDGRALRSCRVDGSLTRPASVWGVCLTNVLPPREPAHGGTSSALPPHRSVLIDETGWFAKSRLIDQRRKVRK